MTGHELRAAMRRELAELEAAERAELRGLISVVDGRDPADQAARAIPELNLALLRKRITRLRARLADGDRATAAPGADSTLVLDFGNGPETYVLADFPQGATPVVTRNSPLGLALVGARSGQQVVYRTPGGQATVTVIAIDEDRAAG